MRYRDINSCYCNKRARDAGVTVKVSNTSATESEYINKNKTYNVMRILPKKNTGGTEHTNPHLQTTNLPCQINT